VYKFDAENGMQIDEKTLMTEQSGHPLCDSFSQEAYSMYKARMAKKTTMDYMKNEILRLNRAISKLSISKRMMVTMRFIQQLSVADIAAKMCCSSSSVYWLLSQAVDDLAEMF